MTKWGARMSKGAEARYSFSSLAMRACSAVAKPCLTIRSSTTAWRALAALQVFERVVVGRGLGQPGQQGALGQVQVAHVLVEIGLGCGLHAVGHVAIVDLVEVQRQDLVFGVAARQPPGQYGFAQLALERLLVPLLRAQQQVAGQLLGDGAAARQDLAAAQVDPQRPDDGHRIHAGVGVEAGILGGDRRLAQRLEASRPGGRASGCRYGAAASRTAAGRTGRRHNCWAWPCSG